MCGAQRITDQHHVVKAPALIPDRREVAPMRVVADDGVLLQVFRKHLLAQLDGVFRAHVGKARTLPGVVRDLHQEGAHVGAVAVMVGAEHAVLGFAKGQGQAVEGLGRAVPNELVGSPIGGGLKLVLVFCAQPRESAAGPHHQIGLAQLRQVGDVGVEMDGNTQFLHVDKQQRQQLQATNRSKAVACNRNGGVVVHHRDVGPILKMWGQVLVKRFVVGA